MLATLAMNFIKLSQFLAVGFLVTENKFLEVLKYLISRDGLRQFLYCNSCNQSAAVCPNNQMLGLNLSEPKSFS